MLKRSECQCGCHLAGLDSVIHVAPCCEPDQPIDYAIQEDDPGVRYTAAYRAGWNDALEALSTAACAGVTESHWLARTLNKMAHSMKRL